MRELLWRCGPSCGTGATVHYALPARHRRTLALGPGFAPVCWPASRPFALGRPAARVVRAAAAAKYGVGAEASWRFFRRCRG